MITNLPVSRLKNRPVPVNLGCVDPPRTVYTSGRIIASKISYYKKDVEKIESSLKT